MDVPHGLDRKGSFGLVGAFLRSGDDPRDNGLGGGLGPGDPIADLSGDRGVGPILGAALVDQ